MKNIAASNAESPGYLPTVGQIVDGMCQMTLNTYADLFPDELEAVTDAFDAAVAALAKTTGDSGS